MAEFDIKIIQEGAGGIGIERTITPVANEVLGFDANKLPVSLPQSGGSFSWQSEPATPSTTGTAGQMAYGTGGYFYVCIGTNSWVRTPLATWTGSGVGGSGTPLFRELLTANRTYYVATTGSDSNDGLSVGTPFLTIQKALDVAASLDCSIYAVTIQVADGTYSGACIVKPVMANGAYSIDSNAPLRIVGNTSNPQNVIISHANGFVCDHLSVPVYIAGFKMTGANYGIIATNSIVAHGSNHYATALVHLQVVDNAIVQTVANYSITAGAAIHVNALNGGMFRCLFRTVTLTGTPAFSARFAQCLQLARQLWEGTTFSGSATGARYNVTRNAMINVEGAGVNFLPGNSAGATSEGGLYV